MNAHIFFIVDYSMHNYKYIGRNHLAVLGIDVLFNRNIYRG